MRVVFSSMPFCALITTTAVSTAASAAIDWPAKSGMPGVSMRWMRISSQPKFTSEDRERVPVFLLHGVEVADRRALLDAARGGDGAGLRRAGPRRAWSCRRRRGRRARGYGWIRCTSARCCSSSCERVFRRGLRGWRVLGASDPPNLPFSGLFRFQRIDSRPPGRNKPSRSFRNRRPRRVGRIAKASRSTRPSGLGAGERALDGGEREPGALGEEREREALGEAQRVHRELEGQVARPDLVRLLDGVAGERAVLVGLRLPVARLAHHAVGIRELGVRAGAHAEVVAEAPVVEVVARAAPRPREGGGLVVLVARRAQRLPRCASCIAAALVVVGQRRRVAVEDRVGLEREVVGRQVRRAEARWRRGCRRAPRRASARAART